MVTYRRAFMPVRYRPKRAMGHDSAVKTTFNKEFYTTVATVIPVLYLALTVQGQLYGSMLRQGWRRLLRKERDWGLSLRLLRLAVAVWLIVAAVVILAAGLGGEILAIFALYNASGSLAGPWVLLSVIVLVVAAAVGPLWAFLRLPLVHMLTWTPAKWLENEGATEPEPSLGDDQPGGVLRIWPAPSSSGLPSLGRSRRITFCTNCAASAAAPV